MTSQTEEDFDQGNAVSLVNEVIEHARRACLLHRVAFEGTDPQSVRVPPDAVEELVLSLSSTVHRRVCQIVPFATRTRSSRLFSAVIWRQLAQRCDVQRYYLVPAGGEHGQAVLRQVDEDNAHSLRAVSVAVTGWQGEQPIPMNDLWLIDDKVVVRQEFGGNGVASWLVSGHTAEVRYAQNLLSVLNQLTQPPFYGQHPNGPGLTDWMLRSAQMLYAVAQMACRGNHYVDAHDCSWYHGTWQYLRLFDMVSSPAWHAEFYGRQLRTEIHERRARRILISGTADYTTLAFVLDAACGESGTMPDDLQIHILDLCQTPLLACQWYASRRKQSITTYQADITKLEDLAAKDMPTGEWYDLIVADAFLTRFDRNSAKKVVRSWFSLLRPGGRLMTTVRLHARNEYVVQDASDPDVGGIHRVTDPTDDFELRLRERASAWRGMIPIALEDLSRAGRQYANNMTSHDLGDEDDITTALRDQQFELVEHTTGRVNGELIGTEYLRVLASRPSVEVETDPD